MKFLSRKSPTHLSGQVLRALAVTKRELINNRGRFMNINAAASTLTKLPTLDPKTQKAMPIEPEPLDLAKAEKPSAKELLAQAFYKREEEPWKSGIVEYNEGKEIFTREMTKAEYLDYEKSMAALCMEIQQCHIDSFRKKLVELRPDLADRKFSYTLGDDAQVKLIDPENLFDEEQLQWMTDSLNDLPGFTKTVQECAKRIMILVDHDNEFFGNRFSLNLMNFQDTIDFGKLISIKDRDQQQNAWIAQIHENAKRRDAPLVDILA
jgi:hypothetical protein